MFDEMMRAYEEQYAAWFGLQQGVRRLLVLCQKTGSFRFKNAQLSLEVLSKATSGKDAVRVTVGRDYSGLREDVVFDLLQAQEKVCACLASNSLPMSVIVDISAFVQEQVAELEAV